jgi:predicted DCC family thiol-disulfide oxidoreductase YuxK
MIFDGDCGFCSSCARFVERRVPTTAEVVPYQQVELERYQVTSERAAREVLWIGEDGRVAGGAGAIGRLLMESGGWRRVAGRLMLTPPLSWATQGAYRLVARYRYRLPGGTPACRVQ